MRISDWSSDVCSSDLFLACLPIEEVEVVMLTDLLDRGTGHIDAQPVLHLRVALQALGALNLHRAEPAALVDRLGGHMDWRSEERRGGKECLRTCRSRCGTFHQKKK